MPRRPTKGSEGNDGAARGVRQLAGLGIEIALPVVLLMFAGRWLDRRFGTAPWLLVAGAFLGMAVSFYTLFKAAAASTAGGGDKGDGSDR